jgi:transposase
MTISPQENSPAAAMDVSARRLYRGDRKPGPVLPAQCWSHARRKFFELADVEGNIRKGKDAKEISPIAFEAVKRIDALFEIERGLTGKDPAARLEARQRLSAPLLEKLQRWLRSEREQLSKHAKVAKAIDCLLSPDHWPGFSRFLEDGRVCLTNNAAERSLRGVALGRKSWLFAGSERGGQRAAFMYSLIGTATLNNIVSEILAPFGSCVPWAATGGYLGCIFHDGGVRWRMVEMAARCGIR